MAKWWAKAKTFSVSCLSKLCGLIVALLSGLARCAVLLHLACAFVFVVLVAVDAHPVARSWLPKHMEMIFDAQSKLQCGLVLPWAIVLVGATAAKLLWTVCAVALGTVRKMFNCCCCRPSKQSTLEKSSGKEGKDNGPPRMMESAKAPHNPTSHHLRRRTYPKIM